MDAKKTPSNPAPGGEIWERSFARDFGALEAIFQFVSEFFAAHGIDADETFDVQLIIEEMFTNLVKYNKDGTQDIAIELERAGREQLRIRLTDRDVDSFDITQMPDVDTQQRIAEKRVGGLGIHLVRRMADDISYEYSDRKSRITILKRVRAKG